MKRWSDKVTYQGRRVNRGTLAILDAANIILKSKRFGGETSPVTLSQGSYNSSVSQSAGTHDGGGAFDTTSFNIKNREKVFRLLGVAYYDRLAIPGLWSRHGHGIVDGDATASSGAKRQVVSYHNRRNALASNLPDTGYKMLVFPLFVAPWKATGAPGVFYTLRKQKVYEQPTVKSRAYRELAKGEKFTVVARVRVGRSYWGVNKFGAFAPMVALTPEKPKVKK